MTGEELELEGVKGIDKSLISAYRLLNDKAMPFIRLVPIFQENNLECHRLLANHADLVFREKILRDKIDTLNHDMYEINAVYAKKLQYECDAMNGRIHYAESNPILEECRALIQKLRAQQGLSGEPVPIHMRKQICDLINSLPNKDKTYIWKSLYDKRAKGVIEDQWSEIHCHEFLPELEEIVQDCSKKLCYWYVNL
jgi:hypothetical protein